MKAVWRTKIKEILKVEPKDEKDMYLNILSMFIYNRMNDRLAVLYKAIGDENFSKVIDILGGVNIQFPTREEYKELNKVALCHYYKQVKGKTWPEIHNEIGFEVNAIKYGKWMSRLTEATIKEINDNFEQIELLEESGVE